MKRTTPPKRSIIADGVSHFRGRLFKCRHLLKSAQEVPRFIRPETISSLASSGVMPGRIRHIWTITAAAPSAPRAGAVFGTGRIAGFIERCFAAVADARRSLARQCLVSAKAIRITQNRRINQKEPGHRERNADESSTNVVRLQPLVLTARYAFVARRKSLRPPR